jgi:hypothetical protein
MSGDVSYRRVSGQTIFDLTLPTTQERLVGPASNEWGSTS